jgi:hypothetical protein
MSSAHGQSPIVTAASASRTEFHQRQAKCNPHDSNQCRDLAAWAAGHGLFDEADRLYRELLDVDRADDQSRAAILKLAASRKLPLESAALEAAKSSLPSHFTTLESAHFVVLSDAGLIRARKHAELLERAEHQFRRYAARLNLQPLPLEHKLVCVLFRSAEDYYTFAAEFDNVSARWITGHYSPAHDRVVFYDAELAPTPADAQVQLDQAHARIASLEQQARQADQDRNVPLATSLRSQAAELKQRRERAVDELDAFASSSAVATAIHEATHQLLHHTRVQSPYVRAPLWIGEGLATCFETDSPQQAFGPDHEYAPRRADFQLFLGAGHLLPLRDLVQMDSVADDATQRAAVVYAQSYALVKWLSRFKTDSMRRYLAALRDEPSGEPTPARHLEMFETAFGECNSLERACLRHERGTLAKR